MDMKTVILLTLPIALLGSTIFNPAVYALDERKVLSRNYVGLGVEIYAPHQSYRGENITIRVRVEALEDVKNISVTLFIWSSKFEGQTPWGASFTVLEVTNFSGGTTKEEAYYITMPPDIDPGLTYGILFLDWSIYSSNSWENQWDKASFRATYIRNENYENLKIAYNSVLAELQNTRTLMYMFLAATATLTISIAYLARKKPKTKK